MSERTFRLSITLLFLCAASVFFYLQARSERAASEREADRARAATQMALFETGLQMFWMEHRELPSSLEDLAEQRSGDEEPLFARIPVDPWGHAYELQVLGDAAYRFASRGPDGVAGTADDVVRTGSWPPR